MKIFFTSILICFFSIGVYADCGDQLIDMQEQKVGKISPAQFQCIKSESLFLESLEGLCNRSKSSLSDEYKKYLNYSNSYDSKIIDRDNATSDAVKRALNADLYSIESEWQIYGYKWEMEPFIFTLSRSISKCAAIN